MAKSKSPCELCKSGDLEVTLGSHTGISRDGGGQGHWPFGGFLEERLRRDRAIGLVK